MFTTPGGDIHLLVTGETAPHNLPSAVTLHRGSLADFLTSLQRDHGVEKLHCEGGGELVRALAALDVIDVIHLTWSGNVLFGGVTSPTITGVPGDFLPASRHFELTAFEPNEKTGECFLSYRRLEG
jgi:riboflavin biosynthesis pyrimidine reductase